MQLSAYVLSLLGQSSSIMEEGRTLLQRVKFSLHPFGQGVKMSAFTMINFNNWSQTDANVEFICMENTFLAILKQCYLNSALLSNYPVTVKSGEAVPCSKSKGLQSK